MPSRFMAPHAVAEPKAWTICSEIDRPWAQQAGQRALTGSCVQHCPRFRDALSTRQTRPALDRQTSGCILDLRVEAGRVEGIPVPLVLSL